MGNTATTKKGDSTESGEYNMSAVLFIISYIDFRKLCGKFNYLMNFDLGISPMVWYLQLFLSWKEKKVDKKWFEHTGFNPH